MEFSVGARILLPFLRVVPNPERGFAVLEEEDVPLDRDTRLSYSTLERIGDACLGALDRTGLGIRAAEEMQPGDFGIAEQVALNGTSVRDAVVQMARYLSLLDSGAVTTLTESGSVGRWTMGCAAPGRWLPMNNEFAVAVAVMLGRRFVGSEYAPLEVQFTHARPEKTEIYERFFGAPLVFDAAENAISFPRAFLDRPLAGANPALRTTLEQEAQRRIARLPEQAPFAVRVRASLREALREGSVTRESTARRMHMSEATLKRRLAGEGTTYVRLLDEVRFDEARRQLRDPEVDVTEIAFLLGFSAVNSFSRAFVRWAGQSPSEFRKALVR